MFPEIITTENFLLESVHLPDLFLAAKLTGSEIRAKPDQLVVFV